MILHETITETSTGRIRPGITFRVCFPNVARAHLSSQRRRRYAEHARWKEASYRRPSLASLLQIVLLALFQGDSPTVFFPFFSAPWGKTRSYLSLSEVKILLPRMT